MPGMKDYITVHMDDGKVKKQKWLLLCNLNELCERWTSERAAENSKIGFSTFVLLRPKWCVLAGASGTHSVCVCVHHQNPKLKYEIFNGTNNKYSDLMAMGVCNNDLEMKPA